MTEEQRNAAFISIVKEKSHTMYCVALSMVRNRADAEDAVSAAIETAWSHYGLLRNPEALPAYLMRCTVNACHAQYRRKMRETVMEDPGIYMPAQEDETPLWQYLDHLPEKFRVPLIMKYGENMTIEEIAKALRIMRGTASSRLTRGLKMLREQMKAED